MVNSLLPSPQINPAARSSSGMPNFNQAAFYNFPPSNFPPSNFAPSFVDNTAAHHPVLHQAADSSNAEPSTIARGRDFKPALKVGGARQKDRKRKKRQRSVDSDDDSDAPPGLVLLVVGIPGPVVARLCAVAAGLVPDLLAHAQRLLPSVVSPRPVPLQLVPSRPGRRP
ncbi:hypothetical protein R3P38DRAFT_3234563 [Favolaschia claudopus]|uniref:Uncharacterized protein n=1 Tax=Favolaschia claudopus TaxID=2862362 RepID=A0AAV9ZG00_9AGAR